MEDAPPLSAPSEALLRAADSKAFHLLLETHAQEAVERVVKRLLWMLAPAAAVLGLLGVQTWLEVGRWREAASKVTAELATVQARAADVETRASAVKAVADQAKSDFERSSSLLRDMQSGLTATAGILQTQGALVQATMTNAARSTEAQASVIQSQVSAIAAHRERIESDAVSVEAAKSLITESRLSERIEQLKRIESVQAEMKRARSLQLVLLTAHSSQTLEIDDPCPQGRADRGRAYGLTFTTSGLKGTVDRRGDRVVTIAFDVTRPGAEKASGEVSFADRRGSRPFRPLEGIPFEVMLDFRYHYWPFSKDFVALRVRPTETCPVIPGA